jgi:hypothetical protein
MATGGNVGGNDLADEVSHVRSMDGRGCESGVFVRLADQVSFALPPRGGCAAACKFLRKFAMMYT